MCLWQLKNKLPTLEEQKGLEGWSFHSEPTLAHSTLDLDEAGGVYQMGVT